MDEGPCADRARRGGHAGADAADQDGRRAQRGDSAFSFGRVRYRPAARNGTRVAGAGGDGRSEEHTSELQSLMRISYAVFCLKKKTKRTTTIQGQHPHKIITIPLS